MILLSLSVTIGREEILRVHARNKKLADDVSFKVLARMTSGFSGADLENLLNESAILAARALLSLVVTAAETGSSLTSERLLILQK